MAAPDKIFSPAQKERLRAAITQRYSCRAFKAAPDAADWAALCYAAGRYTLPGARLILTQVSESLFTGNMLTAGWISGCTCVAAVVAEDTPKGRLHAGFLGEALCLEATTRGIGSCWIAGTYRKKQLALPLQLGEVLLAVIALGVPAKPLTPPESRKRKSLEKICRGDVSLWPAEPRRVAAAVQQAPSALNMQPWELALEANRLTLDAPDRSLLDLGIAFCHAELAMDTPHVWRYGRERRDPALWAEVRALP